MMRSLSTRDVFFVPAGTEFVRPVVAYFCNLCQLIYADEDEAKIQHCSSPMHYRKYQVRVELPDRVQEVAGESWSQLTVTETTVLQEKTGKDPQTSWTSEVKQQTWKRLKLTDWLMYLFRFVLKHDSSEVWTTSPVVTLLIISKLGASSLIKCCSFLLKLTWQKCHMN